MTQPTIGQRLWDLCKECDYPFCELTPVRRERLERAATELIRGVLTGELPLPEELRLLAKYGPRVSIEGIPKASKHPAWGDVIADASNQAQDEYLQFQAWMRAAVESGATLFGNHISDASK